MPDDLSVYQFDPYNVEEPSSGSSTYFSDSNYSPATRWDKIKYGAGRFLAGDYDWQQHPAVRVPWKATNHVLSKFLFIPGVISHEAMDRGFIPSVKYNPLLHSLDVLYYEAAKHTFGRKNPEAFAEAWKIANGETPYDKFNSLGSDFFSDVFKKPDFKYYGDKLKNGDYVSAFDPVIDRMDEVWDYTTGAPKKGVLFNTFRGSSLLGAFLTDMYAAKNFSPKLFSLTAKGAESLKSAEALAKDASLYEQALSGDRALFQLRLPFMSKPFTVGAPGFFKPISDFSSKVDAYKLGLVLDNPAVRPFYRGTFSNSYNPSFPIRAAAHGSLALDKVFSCRPPLLNALLSLGHSGLDPLAVIKDTETGKTMLASDFYLGKLHNASRMVPLAASESPRSAKLLSARWIEAAQPLIKEYSPAGSLLTSSLGGSASYGLKIPASWLTTVSDLYKPVEKSGRVASALKTGYNWLVNTFLTPTTTVRNWFSQFPQAFLSGEDIELGRYLNDQLKTYRTFAGSLSGFGLRDKSPLAKRVLNTIYGKKHSIPEIFSWYSGGNNGFYMQFKDLRTNKSALSKFLNFLPRLNARVSEATEKASRSAYFLQLLRNGYDPLAATYKTARTFVNYAGLHSWQNRLRYIYPFATFSIGNFKNNLSYLANNPFAVTFPRLLGQQLRSAHSALSPDLSLPESAYLTKYGFYAPLFKNIGIDLSSVIPSTSLFGINPSDISSRFASPYINLAMPFLDAAFPKLGLITPNKPLYYKQKYGPLFGINAFNSIGPRNSDRLTWAFTHNLPFYGWFHNAAYSFNPANNVFYGTKARSPEAQLANMLALRAFPSPYGFIESRGFQSKDLVNDLAYNPSFGARVLNALSGGQYGSVRTRQLNDAIKAYDTFLNADAFIRSSRLTKHSSKDLRIPDSANPWSFGAFLPQYQSALVRPSGKPWRPSEFGTFFHETVQGNKNALRFLEPSAAARLLDIRKDLNVDDSEIGKTLFYETPMYYKYNNATVTAGHTDFMRFGYDSSGAKYADLVDFKFGSRQVPEPDRNGQLMSYMVSIFQNYPDVDYINVKLYQPILGFPGNTPRTYTFRRVDIPLLHKKLNIQKIYRDAMKLKSPLPPMQVRDYLYKSMSESPSRFRL